nr:Zinc finger and Nuclear hormone receptor domain containing protein [Haemonchus contortus]
MSSESDSSVKKKTGRRALKTPVHGDCQICGQPGHGSHFGVLACRACAAFFRRTVVMNRQYSCRRANGSCQISKDERYLCRLCRYNKCLALGMTPDNVQWNRDVLSTTVEGRKSKKSISSIDSDIGNDDYVPQGGLSQGISSTVEASTSSTKPKTDNDTGFKPIQKDGNVFSHDSFMKDIGSRVVFDISPIMAKLRNVLSEFKADKSAPDEPLMRMQHALIRHRRTQRSAADLKKVNSLSMADMMMFWEVQVYAIAEWMMYCEEFAELPLEQKVIIFKNAWMIWRRFERITMSVELFGWRALHEKMYSLTDEVAIKMDSLKFDVSLFTDYDPEYIYRMLQPFSGRLLDEVTKSCLEICLDPIEIVYILCTLVWHVDGKPVSRETQTVAENYLERISDSLHNYYTNVTKTPNYAGRLIKIMSIAHCIENIHYERSKVMELAKIFDVFKVELSEKGLFDC